MANDVIDPLAAYSGINLFPSAFGILPDPSKPHDDLGTDLDGIHKHLKSMDSGSPSKLIEQARSILEGNSNLMQSEAATFLVNNEKKEEATLKVEENPQERRPALNRKRARFSLKPDARQPPVNLEPTFDIKQLKDPEEFFLAYERLENAKREIQKQTGAVLKDLNQQNPSMNTRQRRPGILGRSVRYKHQYSSITSENDQNVEPSQVTFESGNINPSIMGKEDPRQPIIGSEKKADEGVPFEEEEEEEEEFVASITKAENKVNKILDELLSANCEDLEGDQAINRLQECLQIKPINLEKLCLPDFEAIQTMNLKSSRGNLRKRRDNQLQRIEILTSKQDDENSIRPISTPPSMRNPLASLSALNRQISRSNSSGDPFSAHDIDQSPARNPSLFELSNDLSDAVGIAEKSSVSKLKSRLTEDGTAVANRIKFPKFLIGDVDFISKISSSNVLNVPQVGGDAALSGTRASMEAKDISGSSTKVEVNEKLSCLEAQADTVANATNALDDEMEDHEGSCFDQPNTSKVDAIEEYLIDTKVEVNEKLSCLEAQADAVANATNALDDEMEDHEGSTFDQPNTSKVDAIEDYPIGTELEVNENLSCLEAQADAVANATNALDDEMEDHKGSASEQPNTSKVDAIKEYPIGIQSQLDQSTATCTEDNVDGPSRSSGTDHHDKVKPKSRENKQRKGKKKSGRQSLAGAGTTWKCGVRRSTRFKTRPLEYWKGERMLYGRVHESLATVIGWKYVSPGKGKGQPTLRVKSIVSDEYKDLVDLAALH